MSHSWVKRKIRLRTLLLSDGDDDEEGIALDRLLHGQNVIGKTAKTTEIDAIRFQDKDLTVAGVLEQGQFGVVHVVNCRLDGCIYVRKSITKLSALRTRDQCSPQFERDLLLRARKQNSPWAPHLICAYQTPTHLNLVMEYLEGGTLWDVLQSSSLEGRISEADLRWWTPQIVSAIHWCHSQGFVHRDVKPQNFVLTDTAHLRLIDFGSAAPMIPGTRILAKQHCLLPCGTCDYISPEILETHERALVALEMENLNDETYGLETDWWSMGAMLYEMAYATAPFFAQDIRTTYAKIMDHSRSLRFKSNVPLSMEYQDFLRKLLTTAEFRLGHEHISEITSHSVFVNVSWTTISTSNAPSDLHLPQFIYADDGGQESICPGDQSHSKPFAFSDFFQSSPLAASSPGVSFLRNSQSTNYSDNGSTAFIGFSWGPSEDSFSSIDAVTPRPVRVPPSFSHKSSPYLVPPSVQTSHFATPRRAFSTPVRPTPYQTLPRTNGFHSVSRRSVSDREAMKQLLDCVGMSARKKVLESGRKPRTLPNFLRPTKEVRMSSINLESSRGDMSSLGIESETDTETGSEAPPSPSPSPRPGSALSKRSGTPTITATFSRAFQSQSYSHGYLQSQSFPPTSDNQSRIKMTETRMRTRVNLNDETLDELECKHSAMMQDIEDIGLRVRRVAAVVSISGK